MKLVNEFSDEELMRRYQKGEPQAFELLFDRYEGRLRGFLIKRLPPHKKQEAEDLFQMTWLKVHNNRSKFNIDQKFAPWFYTIALNNIRDYMRSPSSTQSDLFFEDSQFVSSNEQNAESTAIKKESFDQLIGALKDLPDRQREIVLLSDWEGFASKEIGVMLGLKDTAVRQQLSRARKALQSQLRGRLG